ncbi:MAG TPA: Holliday junction branch migration protein RuvA [Candidatus Dormibacteraeota bacterium]|nr:Holliday junction branch migration protein RuvA [Candidatus Dormibacteraeota bacterium]
MIALLTGRLASVGEASVVLDVGGVGYDVGVHLRTLAALHEADAGGRPVSLHIHTAVSDDAIRLFGFSTAEELRLFRLLLGVERIGPKAALGILGRAELPTLVRALRAGDVKLVATVPGIGPKTAERVVLELRDRLDGMALPGDTALPETVGRRAAGDAVAGLVGLGFREAEARSAVAAALADLGPPDAGGAEPEIGAVVAAALRRLDLMAS